MVVPDGCWFQLEEIGPILLGVPNGWGNTLFFVYLLGVTAWASAGAGAKTLSSSSAAPRERQDPEEGVPLTADEPGKQESTGSKLEGGGSVYQQVEGLLCGAARLMQCCVLQFVSADRNMMPWVALAIIPHAICMIHWRIESTCVRRLALCAAWLLFAAVR